MMQSGAQELVDVIFSGVARKRAVKKVRKEDRLGPCEESTSSLLVTPSRARASREAATRRGSTTAVGSHLHRNSECSGSWPRLCERQENVREIDQRRMVGSGLVWLGGGVVI